VPLEYRRNGSTDFVVLTGTLAIARISRTDVLWTWALYVSAAPNGLKVRGSASSLEAAKQELEQMWSVWLGAAGLTERQRAAFRSPGALGVPLIYLDVGHGKSGTRWDARAAEFGSRIFWKNVLSVLRRRRHLAGLRSTSQRCR
jgi:hypothetical protein